MFKFLGVQMFFRLLTICLITVSAQASEKAIVVFKDPGTFRRLFVEGKTIRNFQQFGTDRNLSRVKGTVSDVLDQISTIVVEVDSEADLSLLAKDPRIALVEKEVIHPLPILLRTSFTRETTLTMPWGIEAIHAPQAWTASHYGEGARVAILDTGIDRDHPAIKNNFEQGKDLIGGQNDMPYEYFDQVGHGTHVAGTIAAEINPEGFTGVAPKAKILSGRVCSTLGCPNTSIVKGINWAIVQKADVINMSLGGSFATTSEKDAIKKADAAGVVVVAASGNSGTAQVSYPAALPTVIAVGAVDSTKTKTSFSQYGPELDIVAPGAAVLSSVPLGSGRDSRVSITLNGISSIVPSSGFAGAKDADQPVTGTLVDAGLGYPQDFAKADYTGKLALIRRGELTFADKVKNATAAKAAGVVLYNNTDGLVQGSLTSDGSVLSVYVVMIEKSVGEAIKDELVAGKSADAQIETIKTDYAKFDGTSMATPHVAGVVALIKATNKKLTPAQVREIVKSTAEPLGPNTQNQYGAGLIQADAAVEKASSF